LTNEFGLNRVLHEIAHPRVRRGKRIGIDEDSFAAVGKEKKNVSSDQMILGY
jgi:hypothetical protein